MAKMADLIAEAQERREIAFRMIADAAERRLPFPPQGEIARRIGCSPACATQIVQDLCDAGRIEVTGYRNTKQARIVGTPFATASDYDLLPPTRRRNVRELVRIAARIWDCTVRDIFSNSRFAEHVEPRQAVCLVAFSVGWSVSHIGRVIDRDHSTVNYSVKRAEKLVEQCPLFAAKVAELAKYGERERLTPAHFLDLEQTRYRLPQRGRALSEMVV